MRLDRSEAGGSRSRALQRFGTLLTGDAIALRQSGSIKVAPGDGKLAVLRDCFVRLRVRHDFEKIMPSLRSVPADSRARSVLQLTA